MEMIKNTILKIDKTETFSGFVNHIVLIINPAVKNQKIKDIQP
ncbi:hypothetical protein [Mycoplasma capricolum]|nr:hypothetical protein [Mycoplasma capricolum]